jgi:hypothetical protein
LAIGELIRVISIFSILVPLTMGLLRRQHLETGLRYFWIFLVFAFLVDVGIYLWVKMGQAQIAGIVFSIYSLVEALVFFSFTRMSIQDHGFRKIATWTLALTPVYWVMLVTFTYADVALNNQIIALFDPVYQVVAAFLSGFALLALVESNPKPSLDPSFWILLGIFLYCFCTFFILGLVNTVFGQNIWWLHNVFNITAYGLYARGFWMVKRV